MQKNENNNDKQIIVKLVQDKKATLTFVENLADFYDGDEIKNVIKLIQDAVQTKIIKKKNNDGKIECGFEGNHIESIKEILKDKTIFIKDETQSDKTIKTLDNINVNITLKCIKEKKTCRTYITGLSKFLSNEDVQNFAKKLQKILGTGSIINNDGDCGFNGDYTIDTCKKAIIKKHILEYQQINKEYVNF